MASYFFISIYKMSFFSLKHYTCYNSYIRAFYVKVSTTNTISVLLFKSSYVFFAFVSSESLKEAMISKNKFKS